MEMANNYLKDELDALIAKENVLLSFLDLGSVDGIWFWDIEHPENEWMSPRFWTTLGYDPAEKKHLSREWQKLINPDDLKVAIRNFELHCQDPSHPYDQIVRYQHKNGSTVWLRCRGFTIRNDAGKVVRMLGIHNNITEYKNAEMKVKSLNAELEKLSTLDSLTNLLNRREFFKQSEILFFTSGRLNVPISFLFIDIDSFKLINDSYGHSIGDDALVAVSNILSHMIKKPDIVCRYGGDELVVAVLNFDMQSAKKLANCIRNSVAEINAEFKVTVSIGISTLERDYKPLFSVNKETYKNLINQSDKAMYVAKQKGKNQVCHYNELC